MNVVVLAGAAPGPPQLDEVLLGRAAGWAAALAPGRAYVAGAPAPAETQALDLPAAHGDGALIAAAGEAVGTPVVVVGVRVPRLGAAHADGALEDLDSGADLVLGATLSGGWYLVGMRESQGEILRAWPPPYRLADLLSTATAGGLEVGILRHERDLTAEEDRRAMLADPLVDARVRAALATS